MLFSSFSRTRAFHEEITEKTKTEGRRHKGKPEEQKQKRRLLHSFITPSASPSTTANQVSHPSSPACNFNYFVTVASIPNNSRMPAAMANLVTGLGKRSGLGLDGPDGGLDWLG